MGDFIGDVCLPMWNLFVSGVESGVCFDLDSTGDRRFGGGVMFYGY